MKNVENDERRRSLSRRNKIEAVVLVSLVALLLLGVVVFLSPLRNVVIPPNLPPTATLLSGDDLLYIRAAPVGSVTLDGHVLAHLPFLDYDGNGTPLHLSRGQHLITWHADPFKPISCVIYVPSLPTGETCHYAARASLPSGQSARIINFTVSSTDLPDNLRAALVEKAQEALDSLQSMEVVQSGERYLRAQSPSSQASVSVATQPLQATLRFSLDTDPASNRVCNDGNCYDGELSCRQFCTLPDSLRSEDVGSALPAETANSWDAVAVAYASWEYKTASGQVVAQDQPSSSFTDVGTEHSIVLHTLWDGHMWHVTVVNFDPRSPLFDDMSCVVLKDHIKNNSSTYDITQGNDKLVVSWSFVPAAKRALGCLAIATPSSNSTPTTSTAAYFLYRFGMLLAANERAQRYFPKFPIASAYEQGVAQEIAVSPKAA